MQEIGLGLLGFGTVGAGVVEGLQRNGDLIAARAGVRPVLRKIADLDLDHVLARQQGPGRGRPVGAVVGREAGAVLGGQPHPAVRPCAQHPAGEHVRHCWLRHPNQCAELCLLKLC